MMRHFDGMEEGGRGRDRSVAGPFAQMATDAKQTSRVHPTVHKRVSDCLQCENLSKLILEFAGHSRECMHKALREHQIFATTRAPDSRISRPTQFQVIG